ncbi:MAG: sarcosine oxidase subunit delta, partial [Pseudomonadota bacterium]|nr:sarcosine oxidase subunit delta [Pseudomonadota bacterium]
HENGCNSWLVVTRNTTTHEVLHAELVTKLKGDGS